MSAPKESLKDILSQQYHCQFCGNTFNWDVINTHERTECPKRPTKDTSDGDYIPLPDFQITEDEPLIYKPPAPFIAEGQLPLSDNEFDHLMERLSNENKLLDEVIEQSTIAAEPTPPPTTSSPPPAVSTNALKTIFDKYLEKAPHSTPSYPIHSQSQSFTFDSSHRDYDHDRFAFKQSRSSDAHKALNRHRSLNVSPTVEAYNGSQCAYCHRPFDEGSLAHKIMHQRVCPKNPTAVIACVFCAQEFRSTLDVLALELVALHEELCSRNPRNQCRFCGQSFSSGTESDPRTLRATVDAHIAICKMNPYNKSQCQFCSRVFETNAYGEARAQCLAHARNCGRNPRNSCRFCGLQFQAPLDSPPAETAVAQRRRHEASCVHRPRNSHSRVHHEAQSDPVRVYRYHGTRSEDPHKMALRQIREIDEQVASMTPSQLRRTLRQLQLQWHPDKNLKSEAQEKMALLIFHHVQDLWDAAFSKKRVT